jgi:hypothetical protein
MTKFKAYSSYSIACKGQVEVNFVFENIWVRNSKNAEAPSIFVFIEYEVEAYESMTDASVHARPYYLNILGVLSFLINEPLDVFGAQSGSAVFPQGITSLDDYSEEYFLRLNGADITDDLRDLLESITNLSKTSKTLIYSLLDRWRKGYYLENEDNENLIHYDEASLIYFHIVEILSSEFADYQKASIKKEVKNFTGRLLKDYLHFKGERLTSLESFFSKTIISLVNQENSVYSKIMYMLASLGLYNDETDFFVENFIAERNNVAHGKKVYHDKAIFPVTPFYPIIRNPNYSLSTFRYFAACLMSKYLKIDLYDEIWNESSEHLFPSYDSCAKFLKENKFKKPNRKSKNANYYFGGINNFIRNKPSKILEAIPFYEKVLAYKALSRDFYASNVVTFVLILEETDDEKIEKLFLKALDKIDKLGCNPYSKYRDMVYHLRYDGFEPKKLIEYLKVKRLR